VERVYRASPEALVVRVQRQDVAPHLWGLFGHRSPSWPTLFLARGPRSLALANWQVPTAPRVKLW
jgi:hypothetical protein